MPPTGSHLRDAELHARIRRLIDDGRLPLLLPDKISAGYGSGSRCHGCDQPVTLAQVEYTVEDHRDTTVQLKLHLGCYVLWQVECVKRLKKRQRGSLLN